MEKNLFTTDGRIRRLTYWTRFIVICGVGIISQLILKAEPGLYSINLLISVLLSIFLIIQGFKRTHDVGKNGWYTLIPIYNLILHLTEGTPGNNKYGGNPKELVKHEVDFFEGVSNLFFSVFISCAVYALLSLTTNSSESLKDVVFLITIASSSLFLFKGNNNLPPKEGQVQKPLYAYCTDIYIRNNS